MEGLSETSPGLRLPWGKRVRASEPPMASLSKSAKAFPSGPGDSLGLRAPGHNSLPLIRGACRGGTKAEVEKQDYGRPGHSQPSVSCWSWQEVSWSQRPLPVFQSFQIAVLSFGQIINSPSTSLVLSLTNHFGLHLLCAMFHSAGFDRALSHCFLVAML